MRNLLIWLSLLSICLWADKVPLEIPAPLQNIEPELSPWFTGPLLAPSGLTVPKGHWNIEPYIYVVANIGHYHSDWHREKTETFWNNYFQPTIQVGITDFLDFQFNPTLFYNYTKGAGKWVVGDMPIGFDIQLYQKKGKSTDWLPALKLFLKEVLPLGKYQNLQPAKLGTDVGGLGSWQTAAGLVWGNLFYLGDIYFISWRTALQYTMPSPVHVKNLNAYGGAQGTHGTVYPAQNFSIDTAIEITLAQNWAFAMDVVGSWSGKTRFKGEATAPMTAPPSAQFSVAPALEYNWNADLGVIFGCWFTLAGRNATQFFNGVFAVNYYY